jgi:hypothetical protein
MASDRPEYVPGFVSPFDFPQRSDWVADEASLLDQIYQLLAERLPRQEETVTEADVFSQWCVVELLGHRRTGGLVTEVQLAGHGFLRLDIPAVDADGLFEPARTQFVAPASVYALHPTTQVIATAAARATAPPIRRYELFAAEKPGDEGLDEDTHDFGDGYGPNSG